MESAVQHSPLDEQDGLVREHCREAETLIALAGTRAKAMRIKGEQCRQFQMECKSTLIVNAARVYLDRVITQQYGTNRTNNPD